MKLLRYGARGHERPGLLDASGQLRDLSAHMADLTPADISPSGLARIAEIDVATLPRVTGDPRIGVPLRGIGKIVAIGLNYVDHARESGLAVPAEPPVFMKSPGCLNGPNDEVMLPKHSTKADWEVELGVVIGSTTRYVAESAALERVAGYVLANDVSERQFQLERGSQWDKGKGCDTFGPVGPWLVTADEVGDPQSLDMFLEINGRRMQSGNTRDMVFTVRRLVSYVSEFMTLYPGDLIVTGTPAGVGMGQKPTPIWLRPGDLMHLGISGLGEQRQRVIAWRDLGHTVLP